MQDREPTEGRRRNRKLIAAAGLLAAGALAGGVIAGTLSASAAETSSSASSTTAPAAAQPGTPRDGDAGRATPVRPGEKALTGSDADKARAAALKAVSGGTVYRVETDADGDAYEAHMTKSDGSLVTVKLDGGFNVTSVEDGMGAGRPASSASGTGA